MESSSVPPGFRFHPTDEELVGYYLRKKVASQKIDLDVIRDIDLYRIEPWDLQERCRIGYEEQNEWHFFSHKDKKYPTGTRTNRATMAGFWKATGRDKAVYDKSKLIGMRKTLVFYKGRAPNGQKTDWIMHEYRLESDVNGSPQEEGWVVCRAFQKRTNGQAKNIETWGSRYFCDEVSSVTDPLDYISKQQHNFLTGSYICKQEIERDGLNLLHSDQFIQLPHLESPSLPPIKMHSSSVSPTSEDSYKNNEEKRNGVLNRENKKKKVTDWRALDRFVASQLMSQEDDREAVSGFGDNNNNDNNDSEMASSFSLQNDREEENKFVSGFLNSSSDCDIRMCVFDE